LQPDITVAARLTTANDHILDYYVFPRIDILASQLLSDHNSLAIDVYRFDNLSYFLELAMRTQIEAA